jgi:hypothetical protein
LDTQKTLRILMRMLTRCTLSHRGGRSHYTPRPGIV